MGGALRLRDHELAADQLDRVARPEEADLDEPLVLGTAEASGPRFVRHHAHAIGAPRDGQRARMETARLLAILPC